MEQITCCICHVIFYITEAHKRSLLDSHDVFYCPAGHSQHFTGESPAGHSQRFTGDSEEERLKRELAGETKSKNYWRTEAERYRRSKIAYRGLLTREKNKDRC